MGFAGTTSFPICQSLTELRAGAGGQGLPLRALPSPSWLTDEASWGLSSASGVHGREQWVCVVDCHREYQLSWWVLLVGAGAGTPPHHRDVAL